MKNFLLKGVTIFIFCYSQIVVSQVGIGTTTPNAALEITSTNDGLLIPRIALANTTTATVTTPISSELVYNTATVADVTPGFYFWNGTTWVRITTGASSAWSLTGNSGTTVGTNFIGTTDAQDFRIKTGVGGVDRWNISNSNSGQLQSYSLGSAAIPIYSWQTDPNTGIFSPGADILGLATSGSERFRVEADGDVGIGTTAATYKLSVRHDQDGFGVMSVDNATAGGFSGVYFLQNTSYRGHVGYVNTGGVSTFGGKGFYQLASGDRPMVFSVGTVGSELFLERMRIDQIGNVGIGTTNPTAKLNIAAGTASAGTAPLKFTNGTNLTAPENGAVEYDGTNYFATSGGTRYTLAKTLTNSASLNFGNIANGASEILTIPVAGAALGDPVTLGIPSNVMTDGRLDYQAWVSAADVVSVRFLNLSGGNVNPAAGTFKVSVVKF